MSEQTPALCSEQILHQLEQILHFPDIISPTFIFFRGDTQLTAQHVNIGRALDALTQDEIPNVATTWIPVAVNVYNILECCLIALPELDFIEDGLPVLDLQWLGLVLSHLRDKYSNSLVKDSDGSILINGEVVAFVVTKYCLEKPYTWYDPLATNTLLQVDNNHPQQLQAGIARRFHQLNAVIHSVIRIRIGLFNEFGSDRLMPSVQDIRSLEAQPAVLVLDPLVSDLPVVGTDETNDVSDDGSGNISYSLVASSEADKIPYKVHLPQKMFQDLYCQAFPSGHYTYTIEEEGYITEVTHAIMRSITWQTAIEPPDFVNLWVTTHDESLLAHRDWDQENLGNIDGRFPPRFQDALISLYKWGRNLEQPRIIQLMLWEVGTGPGPTIQVHDEPTDYVWISCLPQDEEHDWCYGSMKPIDT